MPIGSGGQMNLQQIFVDDDKAFAQLCRLNLASRFNALSFHSPVSTLEYLISCSDFAALMENNGPRNPKVSVVVVDYAMPEMDGLEFCRRVSKVNPYIRKVMLTGKADEKLAVEAFNKGDIHYFLRKDSPDLAREINRALDKAQRDYLLEVRARLDECDNTSAVELIREARSAMQRGDMPLDEVLRQLPDILRYFLDLILQDINYGFDKSSSAAVAARGLAALSARLESQTTG